MGSRMKTTIEISDALLRAAKRRAVERDTTLRAIVETALRRYLEAVSDPAEARPRLRRHSFRGRGLQPGLSESDWAAIRERAYEGRGG
jgi:Arc/MetJ family transcription regulator